MNENTNQMYPEYNGDYDNLIYDMTRHLCELKNIWNWFVEHSESPFFDAEFMKGKLYGSGVLDDNLSDAANVISEIIAYAIISRYFWSDKKENIK